MLAVYNIDEGFEAVGPKQYARRLGYLNDPRRILGFVERQYGKGSVSLKQCEEIVRARNTPEWYVGEPLDSDAQVFTVAPAPSHRQWSAAEKRRVLEMWQSGMSAGAIQKAIKNRTRNAILGTLGRMGALKDGRPEPIMVKYNGKPERNAALFSDYLSGMSQREVAEKYNLSPSTVSNLLKRHKVKLPEEERRRRFVALARQRVAEGRMGRALTWPDCPPHLLGEYRRLQRSQKFTAREAMEILKADMAHG